MAFSLILLALSAALAALWRRALGGWTKLPGGILRWCAFVPGLPLFPVLPPLHAAVFIAAGYRHFLPSHTGLLDMSDWRDFLAMTDRYSQVPVPLALAACIAGYAGWWAFLPVGPLTALGYAAAKCWLSWVRVGTAPEGNFIDGYTAIGELVMALAFVLPLFVLVLGGVAS